MNVLLRTTEKMLSLVSSKPPLNRAAGYGAHCDSQLSAFHQHESSSVNYGTWPFGVLMLLRANPIIVHGDRLFESFSRLKSLQSNVLLP